MKRSAVALGWLALLSVASTSACVTEYGRSRAPFARPVLLKLPATCDPIHSGPSTLAVGVTFEGHPIPGTVLRLTPLSVHAKVIHAVAGVEGRYNAALEPGVWELECSL